jgi:transcriptional regulator with XRE-family HTH domain
MNDLKKVVSNNLKLLKRKHDLTQAKMAEKLEIALRTYQGYEQEERFPKAIVIDRICSAFDISREQLFLEDLGSGTVVENSADGTDYKTLSILIDKFGMLNQKNQSMIIQSIDQMLKGQELANAKKRQAN